MMKFIFSLLLFITSSSIAQVLSSRLNEVIPKGCYGKAFGDKLLYLTLNEQSDPYIGVRSNKLNQLDKIIEDGKNTFPIGWTSEDVVILFKKTKRSNLLYQLNVNNGNILREVKIDSVFEPELYVANDNQVVIYVNHYLRDIKLRTYKYDFRTQRREQIFQLAGKKIQRIAYNDKKGIIAFIESVDDDLFLSVLDDELVKRITKLNSNSDDSEQPIAFSGDGENLFYINEENNCSNIYVRNLNSNVTAKLFQFNVGVRCVDMSYSKNTLFMTIKGVNSMDVSKTFEDLNHSYEIGFKFPYSIYSISFNSAKSDN